MTPTALAFIAAAFCSTFVGGLLALRLRGQLRFVMAFAAGVLLGVVAFEILPELIEQIGEGTIDATAAMLALVAGFLTFHILEKLVLVHHMHEGDYAHHHHPKVGMLSAAALIGHSFLDGVGIGLGFQVDPSVGILVAIAVIAHDFTDGMNTVTLMLLHRNTPNRSKAFLFADALAPVAGAFAGMALVVPPQFLALYLGFFAGFLLYIGASDILPEAHSEKSSGWLIALTVAGVAVAFAIAHLAPHAH